MRVQWAGADKSIRAKMCYKLVDNDSWKILCRPVIFSATKPGTTNQPVNPIELLLNYAILDVEEDTMFDKFMFLVDLETPFSNENEKGPVNSIPVCTRSKTWQDIERGEWAKKY